MQALAALALESEGAAVRRLSRDATWAAVCCFKERVTLWCSRSSLVYSPSRCSWFSRRLSTLSVFSKLCRGKGGWRHRQSAAVGGGSVELLFAFPFSHALPAVLKPRLSTQWACGVRVGGAKAPEQAAGVQHRSRADSIVHGDAVATVLRDHAPWPAEPGAGSPASWAGLSSPALHFLLLAARSTCCLQSNGGVAAASEIGSGLAHGPPGQKAPTSAGRRECEGSFQGNTCCPTDGVEYRNQETPASFSASC